MAINYTSMVVLTALHKAVRRVYSASPWSAEDTVGAVYAIAHHQSCTQHQIATRLLHWLHRNTQWDGEQYTDIIIQPIFHPEGHTPAWCAVIHLLLART